MAARVGPWWAQFGIHMPRSGRRQLCLGHRSGHRPGGYGRFGDGSRRGCFRRHGMGFLGLGSTITMLRMKYGSREAVGFTERVSKEMALAGWEAGLELAEEKGPAPIMDEEFVVTREMLLQRGNDEPADKKQLSKPGTVVKLTVGDVVEEHVEVVSNSNHNYVAVVVPLAAGLEPLNPKLATAPAEATPSGTITATPSYVAYMDDQVAFYYDALPKGTYHFYFRTRATVPGQFTQPRTNPYIYYDLN